MLKKVLILLLTTGTLINVSMVQRLMVVMVLVSSVSLPGCSTAILCVNAVFTLVLLEDVLLKYVDDINYNKGKSKVLYVISIRNDPSSFFCGMCK